MRMTGSFRNSRGEMPGSSGLRRCENGSEGGWGRDGWVVGGGGDTALVKPWHGEGRGRQQALLASEVAVGPMLEVLFNVCSQTWRCRCMSALSPAIFSRAAVVAESEEFASTGAVELDRMLLSCRLCLLNSK
jgi:hypothetical protein